MSLKLILRTENSKAGIISKFLRFISFRAEGPSPQHSVELFGVTNDGEFDILLRIKKTHGLDQL